MSATADEVPVARYSSSDVVVAADAIKSSHNLETKTLIARPEWHNMDIEDVCKHFDVNPDCGLAANQVLTLGQKHGYNQRQPRYYEHTTKRNRWLKKNCYLCLILISFTLSLICAILFHVTIIFILSVLTFILIVFTLIVHFFDSVVVHIFETLLF